MVDPSKGAPRADLPRALFVCVKGAGRSVMAATLWQAAGGAARARGKSPADTVYPEAVEALAELGLTPRVSVPSKISPEDLRWAELVIRIDCSNEVEVPPGSRTLDWSLPVPSGQGLEGMRGLRDAIRDRIAVEAQPPRG
jgi:arsenate reductase (thioredoxin)